MKKILTSIAALVLASGVAAAQDVPALVERLKDNEAFQPAQAELLKAGPEAAQALREAAAKSEEPAFKKRAAMVADRLETRQAAAGLAAAWGDRWYALFISDLKCGWVHLKAESKDGLLVFADELFVQPNKDQSTTIKIAMTCRPDEYLTPLTLSLESTGGDAPGKIAAKVKEDRLIVSASGEMKAQRIRANTVVDMALLRLVTILPRTQDYPIALLELVKPKLKEGAAVKFDREESIELKGEKVNARRFIVSDGESEDRIYWTGAPGHLYRVQAGAIEAVLSDEKKAKDLDTKD